MVGNGGANGGNGTGTDTTPSESSGTPAFDIPEPTVTSLEGVSEDSLFEGRQILIKDRI